MVNVRRKFKSVESSYRIRIHRNTFAALSLDVDVACYAKVFKYSQIIQ
jgi:hypothetical protein